MFALLLRILIPVVVSLRFKNDPVAIKAFTFIPRPDYLFQPLIARSVMRTRRLSSRLKKSTAIMDKVEFKAYGKKDSKHPKFILGSLVINSFIQDRSVFLT